MLTGPLFRVTGEMIIVACINYGHNLSCFSYGFALRWSEGRYLEEIFLHYYSFTVLFLKANGSFKIKPLVVTTEKEGNIVGVMLANLGMEVKYLCF